MKKLVSGILFIAGLWLVLSFLPTCNPKEVNPDKSFLPISWEHLMGTDDMGRDIFSLMVVGFFRSVEVLMAALITSATIGTLLGSLSGYYGGKIRILVRVFSDVSLIVPSLIMALLVVMVVGNYPAAVGFALGIYGIGAFAYQSENLTRKIKEEEFIKGEKLLGTPNGKILFSHIMANNLPPLLATLGSQGGSVIIAYASLTFIGLGTDITTPDWGSMIYQYRFHLVDRPYMVAFPAVGILALALLFHYMFEDWKEGEEQ